MDNFSGHKLPENFKLKNIEIAFLPANSTSLIQLLDAGIINSFKNSYQNSILEQFLFNYIENSELKAPTLSKVFLEIKKSWEGLREEIIINCGRKTLEEIEKTLLTIIEIKQSLLYVINSR